MSIDDLSKKQVSKLLNGHPVRVKMGSGAKIQVSAEQAKKMNKASMKGCAITLTLDPYAILNNQHLRDAVGMLRKAGVLKGGKDGGTLLIDEPLTARQIVNKTGDFFKDPGKTLGFGAKRGRPRKGGTLLIDEPITARQIVNTTGNFFKNPGKTLGFGIEQDIRDNSVIRAIQGRGIEQDIRDNSVIRAIQGRGSFDFGLPEETAAAIRAIQGRGFEGPLPSPDRAPITSAQFRTMGRGRRMKGDGFWEDLGSVTKHVGKTAAKALANEIVQYAGPAAAAAFAAAAVATGNPEFAPAAAILGNQLGNQAGHYANSKIQGMGRKRRGGTLLIDEPITARQIVNSTGNFFKDPGKTLGFGARKRRGKGFVEDIANFGNTLMPVLDALKPQYNDYGVGDAVARSVGLGLPETIYGNPIIQAIQGRGKKPKRVMSEAQKAALAKGRAALRIKLNEMGAGVKKRKSGMALRPAGY